MILLTPAEYPLIKILKTMHKIFKETKTIPEDVLTKFCHIVLKNNMTKGRFAAMYECCYDSAIIEEKTFFDLSRKIDYTIVEKRPDNALFGKYDDMMNNILGHDDTRDMGAIGVFKKLRDYYNKTKEFKFLSIVIPSEKKKKIKKYKFDPVNIVLRSNA